MAKKPIRRRGIPAVLKAPAFRRLYVARTIAALGDRMAPVALAFGVLEATGSPTALGVVLASSTLATAGCLLVGGVVSDRLGPRDVIFAADAVRFAAQAATAVLLVTGHAGTLNLVVLQVVNGAALAFFLPAAQAIVPATVSSDELQPANALLGLARNVCGIVGPALAGAGVAATNAGYVIAVDSATFFVSAMFVLGLPRGKPQGSAASFVADIQTGWREFMARSWIWLSVLTFGVFQLVGVSCWLVLGPYASTLWLDGARSWALLLASSAAGAVAGGFLALRLVPARPLVWLFVLQAVYAAPLALLALVRHTPVIAVAAFAAGAAISLQNTYWYTALQAEVAPDVLARVSSFDWLGSIIFLPLGMAVVGPVASVGGTRLVLLGAAIAVVAISLVTAISPPIARVDAAKLGRLSDA